MDLSHYTRHFYRLLYLANLLLGVFASTNNTEAETPEESHQYYVQKKDKGFPVWLIGVIILSSIALIVLVATIVQRIMRRRSEMHEQYRMAS